MSNQDFKWTPSAKRGFHHCHIGDRLVGVVSKQSSPLGLQFFVLAHPRGKADRHLGSCGGGAPADALARAKKMLEDFIAKEEG